MHGAADGGLLGWKKLERRVHHAFILAVVKHPKGAFNAPMGRLGRSFEAFKLDPIGADTQALLEAERRFALQAIGHGASDA